MFKLVHLTQCSGISKAWSQHNMSLELLSKSYTFHKFKWLLYTQNVVVVKYIDIISAMSTLFTIGTNERLPCQPWDTMIKEIYSSFVI